MASEFAEESPYKVLGLDARATRDEVKEAFRRLCLQYHPDKCAAEYRPAAEVKFKEIKSAYEYILKGQAGYAPPPPGSAASTHAASAYWRAQSADGRVPWGKYGGYLTEMEFYRAMGKNSRSNLLLMSLTGLIAIPLVSGITAAIMGGHEDDGDGFWSRFKEQGIDVFSETYSVNGQQAHRSPYQVRDQMDSYIFKSDKYAHLRDKPWLRSPSSIQGHGGAIKKPTSDGVTTS